jgi:hypothetical protein
VDNDVASELTVYVSSSAQDLEEYRAATIAAARKLGCRCLAIEEERHFADQWLHSMRSRIRPSAAGWYYPPLMGSPSSPDLPVLVHESTSQFFGLGKLAI